MLFMTLFFENEIQDCVHGLPDPENCCGYLRCIWSNSRHEQETSLERVACANGTAWNIDKKYCDHFSYVDCGTRDDTCFSKTKLNSTGQTFGLIEIGFRVRVSVILIGLSLG